MKIRNMKKTTKALLALCATLGLGGCDLSVPDLNRPSVESLEQNPTRSGIISASTGLLIGHRAGMASQNGYVSMVGVLGRESYVLDTADPRYISEMLAGSGLDPGSPAFGGNFWVNPYANIRNANTLLNALQNVTGVSDTEKAAIRGYAKTIQALDFLVIINTRDTNGAPIDVNRKLGDPLAPIESKEAVLAHIATLLDEAKVDLEAGGSGFPFPLSTGFDGFDKPSTFIPFNRAVKARVDVYRQDWNQALADLDESFLDDTKSLDLGVYHAFGTGSGDTQNVLNDPDIFVHPGVVADAEKQADGKLDDRVLRKVKDAPEERKWQDVSSKYVFAHYPTATSPLPIIRNEELILLRAEAHIGLGTEADRTAAMADLNLIRQRSGKLAPISEVLAGNALVNELLKERRYSLLFEGGHRWIDMRRYNKLNELPLDAAGHRVHERFPIPLAEMDARQ
jgi:starch-binding outer membrane protein, SusD/RagB family